MSSSPVGRALSAVEGGFDMEGDLEGVGGEGRESSFQAALAASRRAEAKSAQVMDDFSLRAASRCPELDIC